MTRRITKMEPSYGNWTILGGPYPGPNDRTVWLCRCKCGLEKLVYGYNLRSGKSTGCHSCSLLGRGGYERATSEFSKNFSHIAPKVRNKLRQAIWAATARCTNEKHPQYEDYGGRGIRVNFSDRVTFFEYLITLPGHDNYSLVIDRINNNGHYEPGNLRFVNRSISQLNRRNAKRLI